MKLFLFVVSIILTSSFTDAIETGVLRAKREAAADLQAADTKVSSKSYVRLGRTVNLPVGDESEHKSELKSTSDDATLEQELFYPELVEEKLEYDPDEEDLDEDVDRYEWLEGDNKRGAGDRNFVRMGKSNSLGEILSDEYQDKRDGKSFVRMGKDGKSFVRMGKDGKSFVRMGRDSKNFVRMGKDGKSFVRMGKDGKSYVRMGRDGKSFVRMGKAVDFQDNDALVGSNATSK